MRLVVLSDIHGNYAALESVLNQARKHDVVVCLGDYLWTSLGNGPIIEWVRTARSQGAVLLRGNSDSMDFHKTYGHLATSDPRREFEVLQDLPEEATLSLGGYKLYAVHDYPKPADFSEAFRMRANLSRWMTPCFLSSVLNLEHVDILLFGDIHLPYVASSARLLVLNPGGVGYNLDGDTRASFMVLEAQANEIVVEHRRAEYDVEKAVKDVERGHADPVLGRERGESFRRLIMGGRPEPFEWRKEWGRIGWKPGDRTDVLAGGNSRK